MKNRHTGKKLTAYFLSALLFIMTIQANAVTGSDILGLSDGTSGQTYVTLQLGSRDGDDDGASVVALQTRLAELNYLYTEPDGQYGSGTQTAVKKFQTANGMAATGIADSSVQSVLYSKFAVANTEVLEETDVLRTQRALIRWGFLTSYADGILGDATKTAVAVFKDYIYNIYSTQYSPYVSPTPTIRPTVEATATPGSLDPMWQPVVEDKPLNKARATSIPVYINGMDGEIGGEVLRFVDGEEPFVTFQKQVQMGATGTEVLRVQRRLCALKYLYTCDGGFGSLTVNALKYFQHLNGLKVTGVADAETQRILFSDGAIASDEYVFPYKIGIDTKEQKVYVYEWTEKGFTNLVHTFICSTGKEDYETPKGTYHASGRATYDPWYYFEEYDCFAMYAYRIVGGIMFHSVLFNAMKEGPTMASLQALGTPASHGCVRLQVEDAQWIFENCPAGTTVVIK